MNTNPVVLIVEDNFTMRRWLERMLNSAAFDVKTFSSAPLFLESQFTDRPGCLLLADELPGMSGLELLHLLRRRGQSLATVMTTTNAKVPRAVEALKMGARDYLEKPLHPEILLLAVQSAVAASTKRWFVDSAHSQVEDRLETLSPRERQVMNLLAAGRPTKSAALELGVSPKTIEHHRPRILDKLGVENVVELAHLVLMSRDSQALPFRPHFAGTATRGVTEVNAS